MYFFPVSTFSAFAKIKEALQKGFDPNFLDGNDSPLSLAASQDDTQMVGFLVQNGAFLDFRSPDFKTPVHRASILGYDRGEW